MKRLLFTLGGVGIAAWTVSRLLRSEYSFAGKSIVITGGSRGLGLTIARRLAMEGGRIALFARDEEELAEACRQLRGIGGDALAVPCDLLDRGQSLGAIETVLDRFGAIDPTDGGTTARTSAVADYQHTTSRRLTRATAYLSRYRLNLYSDFTYFLDDPVHGDQFEQADRRWVSGGRVSQRVLSRWGARSVESLYGVEVRSDDIPTVGLYHTEARERLETVRQDTVQETTAAASRGSNTARYADCVPPPELPATAMRLGSTSVRVSR